MLEGPQGLWAPAGQGGERGEFLFPTISRTKQQSRKLRLTGLEVVGLFPIMWTEPTSPGWRAEEVKLVLESGNVHLGVFREPAFKTSWSLPSQREDGLSLVIPGRGSGWGELEDLTLGLMTPSQ